MKSIPALVCILVLALNWRPVSAADAISEFKAVKAGNKIHVTATAPASGNWTNTQLLIDTGTDPKAGYKPDATEPHLFDFMVEGSTLYRFYGTDSTVWAWTKLGSCRRQVDGNKLVIDIESDSLGAKTSADKYSFLLRTLTADYQKVTAASSIAKIEAASESGVSSSSSPENAVEAARFKADVQQDGSDILIRVTAKTSADLDTVLIFFDTDCAADTGFQPPADPRFGFEQLIQGESLLVHTGDVRAGWSWKTVGPVKRSATGGVAEFRFDAGLLKSKKVRVSVWQMSRDWQTRTARYPDDAAGTVELALDASKLHADAGRPPAHFAPPRANRDLPARARFQKITSYCCYYGASATAELSHFDSVILHTPAQKAADVRTLNKSGVVTIGYLSVGEDDQLRTGNGKGPGGKASWYFDRAGAGTPDKNGTWNSWYANAADPLWRADRVAEARKLCNDSENGDCFDGIFLDTIETCDSYPQSRTGMIQLVRDLRQALPDKVIVINRGFSLLKEADVSSRIDGLMFESFTDSYDFDSKNYIEFAPQDMDATRQVMTTDVIPATRKYPLRVLALDYCKPDQTARIQKAFDRAATFGMVPAVAPIFLDDVYDTEKFIGNPDPKYLTRQATPESLGITLDADKNGLPAGTRIEPSSCFLGYTVASVVDGIKDRRSLHWSKSAWASAEEPGATQQLNFSFPKPVIGGTLRVTFAFDNNTWRVSRHLRIQTKADDQSPWTELHFVTDDHATNCVLPETPVCQLRVIQEPGGGSADRPELMWIAQVERIR